MSVSSKISSSHLKKDRHTRFAYLFPEREKKRQAGGVEGKPHPEVTFPASLNYSGGN